MATNAAKTKLCNLALAKLAGGLVSVGQNYLTAIDDTEFADWTTASDETTKYLCLLYEDVLKTVLEDLMPNFAKKYVDLGGEIKITQDGANGLEFPSGEWLYMFDVPTDFLALDKQINEYNQEIEYEADILTVHSYAHIVAGTDEQAWYCSSAVTGAAANKPVTGGSYATYWTLFDTDDDYGADFEVGHAYKSSQTGKVLVTNNYSNADDDSAFIRYLGYVQAGFADIPSVYPQAFKDAFSTRLAAEMALHSKDYKRRVELLKEYESFAKPFSLKINNRHKYKEKPVRVIDARDGHPDRVLYPYREGEYIRYRNR